MIDSFKGTVSSVRLSSIIKSELEKMGHNVKSIPISDGGEGFVDSIKAHFLIDTLKVDSIGPLGDNVICEYILIDHVAYIEMNSAAGISLIDEDRLNPLLTSTAGLGNIIKDAIRKGAKKVILGVGGSVTNDGGAGMLQKLGVKFYNKDRLIVKNMNGSLIGEVTSIDTSEFQRYIKGIDFEIASDVKNVLLGENGCAKIYSPQKGASEIQVKMLEENMVNFANIVEKQFGKSFRNIPSSGAAGGIGFGCLSFLRAKVNSGIDLMINLLDLEENIENSDCVIVGEGKLDEQTINGKAPVGIAKLAKKHNKEVVGLFALIDDNVECDYLDRIYSIVPKYATKEESTKNPELYFKEMIKDIKF